MFNTVHRDILILLILLNIAGFIIVGIDKYKAIKHKWRIPEKTLFLFSIFGGSFGVYIGMFTFRHKTKHLKFIIGVPVILALQLFVAWRAV